MSFQERWYQTAAIEALNAYFVNNPWKLGADGLPTQRRNPLVCMPTGTGKSYVIAKFAADAVRAFPQTRILMMTHVKELIEQNANTLLRVWPQAPLGVFSAGLKRKEVGPITYAGVQTIKNHLDKLGHIDLVLIDEAHLLSPNSDAVYQDILARLTAVNPWLVVIGFTATPYRLGIGSLTNNGIFTDTAIDLTSLESFNRLVNEGYIAPLWTKVPRALQIDMSNVGIQNGEYKLNEMQAAADQSNVTNSIVLDILNNAYSGGRRAGLIFCSGVEHAEHVSECFSYYGINVPAVHSKMDAAVRDRRIAQFKAGEVWGLTNNAVLTTGFDHPAIDFIAMIRGTTSTGLWVQMLGRGTRPSPETGKLNCLVYDYAGNTNRLGPINDPCIPKMKGKGVGQAPVWNCPQCEFSNHARAPFCVVCGCPHDMSGNLESAPTALEVMVSETPITEYFRVNQVLYYRHEKDGSPDMIKVMYQCGLRSFFEFVTLEHGGLAGKRGRDWWRMRFPGDPPATTDEALKLTSHLKEPERILVHTNVKYPRIIEVEF